MYIEKITTTSVDYYEKATIVYVKGCSIHCEGCFNKHLWDRGTERTHIVEIMTTIHKLGNNTVIFSGGEPMEQPKEDFSSLIRMLKEDEYKVIIFSGLTREQYRVKVFSMKFFEPYIFDPNDTLQRFNRVDTLILNPYDGSKNGLRSKIILGSDKDIAFYKDLASTEIVEEVIDTHTGERVLKGFADFKSL